MCVANNFFDLSGERKRERLGGLKRRVVEYRTERSAGGYAAKARSAGPGRSYGFLPEREKESQVSGREAARSCFGMACSSVVRSGGDREAEVRFRVFPVGVNCLNCGREGDRPGTHGCVEFCLNEVLGVAAIGGSGGVGFGP